MDSNSAHFDSRIPIIKDLGFREAALDKLKKYVDLIWSANEDLNLVSRKMTFEDLVDNHVIDCLLPLKHFPKHIKKIADLGSGAGLPAIIYALHFSTSEFHLYEKSPKKQDFLKSCSSLGKNFHVHGDIPLNFESIDLVIARGFKPTDVILDMTRNYYNSGGKYYLLKARAEKIEEELQLATKKFKSLKAEILNLTSPVLQVERNLVLIN